MLTRGRRVANPRARVTTPSVISLACEPPAHTTSPRATTAQTFLTPHRDGSVLSFNIALNGRGEYAGGGTWFEGLGKSVPIDKGHVCAHASGVLHGGHPITEGVRRDAHPNDDFLCICFYY